MDLRELRIGNLVNIPVVGEVKVFELRQERVYTRKVYETGTKGEFIFEYTHLSGIPLSPEWLQRLGFKNIGDETPQWASPDPKNPDAYIFLIEPTESGFVHVWDDAYTGASVDFVHQVQNLHFSLTGSELDLTPVSKE